MGSWIRLSGAAAMGLLTLAITPGRAAAGDVTAFITYPSPDDAWDRGYGAALTSTWFGTAALEAEAARVPLDSAEGTMTSFTGNALFAPPIGALVPYIGVGIGIYRQSVSELDQTSTLRTFVVGAKLKLGLLVVRADYRRLSLGGDPLLPMDRRVTLGAGITF
jgi:hypothetical protein